MLKTIMRLATLGLLSLTVAAAAAVGSPDQQRGRYASGHARIAEQVRHELVMLPYYSVFDNLEFRIEGLDTVVLSGQVTKPTLKSDAERAVRNLERVGKVINQIEVLPLSPNDDRIRIAVYRAIYSKPGLDRYGLKAVPSIHIIVKNGNLTLVGVVANKADKDLAFMASNDVAGVFSVTNNLRVEKSNS